MRGLDYYTRTVFEVEAPGAGVGSIGGGGRYDGLVELEGGKPTPGVGFAVGFERATLALEAFGGEMADAEPACVYVANAGAELRGEVFSLAHELRAAGVRTEADYQGRSLKGQFKQADKLGAALIPRSAGTSSPRARSSSATWLRTRRRLSTATPSSGRSARSWRKGLRRSRRGRAPYGAPFAAVPGGSSPWRGGPLCLEAASPAGALYTDVPRGCVPFWHVGALCAPTPAMPRLCRAVAVGRQVLSI